MLKRWRAQVDLVKSKCIKECKLSEDKETCTGCNRTIEELKQAYYKAINEKETTTDNRRFD